MYQQDTCFSAANTPLFTQIFGPSSTTDIPRRSQYNSNEIHPRNKFNNKTSSPTCRVLEGNISAPAAFSSYSSFTSRSDRTDTADAAAAASGNSLIAAEKCREEVSHSAAPNGEVSMQVNTSNKNDSDSSEESALYTSKRSNLPFREVMKELERRFGEQMEVHRGLNTSMRQLDLLKSEISLYQSEQRTTQLALMIQEATLSSFQDAASANAAIAAAASISTPAVQKEQIINNINTITSNSITATTSSPNNSTANANVNSSNVNATVTPSPFLQQVLESYERERSGASRTTTVQSPTIKKTQQQQQQRPPVEVIRPPEEPKPYKRVYFVPVEKHAESVSENTLSDRKYSSSTFIDSSSSVPAAVASAVSTDMSYTDSFERSEGISTDISVSIASQNSSNTSSMMNSNSRRRSSSSSSSGSTILTTNSSITDITQTVTPSSIEEDMSLVRTKQKSGRNNDNDDNNNNNAPLLDGLREFYRACSSANRLMQMVLASDSDVRKHWGKSNVNKSIDDGFVKQQKSIGNDKEKEKNNNDIDDSDAWLSSLRREVGDVRKLRRFINHLRSNIKAMDYQSKVQKARQSLLRKAQRLAKARQRMRRDKSTLSDVMDDIADLIRSDNSMKDVNSDVIDDVATVASLSWGSHIDSVEDSVDDISIYDDVDNSNEDMIMDEVSNVMERSDEMDDEVLDELEENEENGKRKKKVGGVHGSSDVEDIMSEIPSEMNLSRAESEFADILAEASDINDIIEDEIPLPSDNISVVEDMVMSSSVSPSAVNDISTSNTIEEDDINSGNTSAVKSVSEEDVFSSFTELSDPNNGDVSSVFPASTASEKSEVLPSYNDMNRDEIYDDSDSAESALYALESEIRETRKRRTMALSNVHPQTFTELYSTVADPDNNNNNDNDNNNDIDNENERYEDAEAHTRRTRSSNSNSNSISTVVGKRKHSDITITEKDPLLLPKTEDISGKNNVFSTSPVEKHISTTMNDADSAVTAVPRKNTDIPMYAADDLLSQLEWKERQLALFRELRPISERNDIDDKTISNENEIPLEERSEYHWGMLETLLHCRFGSASAIISSGDDSFSYDDISSCDSNDDDTEDKDNSIRETSSHDYVDDNNNDKRSDVLQES